jgi:hypothetical protein
MRAEVKTMNTLSIEPRYVPAQLHLMLSRRPMRRPSKRTPTRLARVLAWLRSWRQALLAEVAAVGAGLEKEL